MVSSSVHAESKHRAPKGHDVRETGKVLRRLAGSFRHTQTQSIHILPRRSPLRAGAERARPPKTERERETVAHSLLAEAPGRHQSAVVAASKLLIAACGSIAPYRLSAALVQEADDALRRKPWTPTTKATTATALRRLLRWLWTNHGAPKLDDQVSKYPALRPRSVTAPRDELDTMLGTAPAPLKLWLLLCSHLAIRSGTAVQLAPHHYDKAAGVLRFITKKEAPVTLPVTEDIAARLDRCNMDDPTPFVRQLWHIFGRRRLKPHASIEHMNAAMQRQLRKHRARLGYNRRIVAHDLRRTTAVELYRHTRDIRDVQALLGHRTLQSTIWYLDHDLRPVQRADLELINRPAWARKEDRTA